MTSLQLYKHALLQKGKKTACIAAGVLVRPTSTQVIQRGLNYIL